MGALLEQARDGDEVIISCNGCTDETVAIARRFEPGVTVLDSPAPSKTGALNLGEQSARTFPRIYMDADIVLGEGALEKIRQALDSGRWLAVSPDPVMDYGGSTWAVRAYYDIWLSLPYCQSGMMGAGVYALSEAGRKRFDQFPDVIADDGYVRALFKEHERGKVKDAKAIVRAPSTLYWLIKIKTRSRMGQMQLAMQFPGLIQNEQKNHSGGIFQVMCNPVKWPKALVYLYVSVISRVLAKKRLADMTQYRWEKDISSRQNKLKIESQG